MSDVCIHIGKDVFDDLGQIGHHLVVLILINNRYRRGINIVRVANNNDLGIVES